MEYGCVDIGRLRCPCQLMEEGECYVCGMARKGVCDCGVGWKGNCPYTEFIQNGAKAVPQRQTITANCDVQEYSEGLQVIRAEIWQGGANRFADVGSFVMAKTEENLKLPLSVMRTKRCSDGLGNDELFFAVQLAGPKSKILIRECRQKGKMKFEGPFYSGLVNSERLSKASGNGRLLVIVRGVAAAPYLNIEKLCKNLYCDTDVFLDKHKLSKAFIADYMENLGAYNVNLSEAEELERLARLGQSSKAYECIIFLAAPFYTKKFLEMLPERKSDIIYSNSANMCCGLGTCGACSQADADGITVRRCKCVQNI